MERISGRRQVVPVQREAPTVAASRRREASSSSFFDSSSCCSLDVYSCCGLFLLVSTIWGAFVQVWRSLCCCFSADRVEVPRPSEPEEPAPLTPTAATKAQEAVVVLKFLQDFPSSLGKISFQTDEGREYYNRFLNLPEDALAKARSALVTASDAEISTAGKKIRKDARITTQVEDLYDALEKDNLNHRSIRNALLDWALAAQKSGK